MLNLLKRYLPGRRHQNEDTDAESVAAIVGEFFSRLEQPEAPQANERRTGRESRVGIEIPENIAVCRKPEDLPPTDEILSGTDKSANVRLNAADEEHVVVMRHGQTAVILVSTDIFGTEQAKRLFFEIRNSLASVKAVERDRVMWAAPDIVVGVRSRKGKSSKVSAETLATATGTYPQIFAEWLEYGMANRATDMHVEVVKDVATLRFRIDGILEPMANGAEGQVMGDLATKVLASVYNKLIDDGSNTSSSFNGKNYFSSTVTYQLPKMTLQLRCQNNPSADGFDFIARFRLESESKPVMTYAEMGYVPTQIAMIEAALKGRRGLIIVAGIPNSGKTTLVQAMLAHFPDKQRYKFVTLDDPVEFKLPGVTHATVKTIAGNAAESAKYYMQAIESWLRGNPDVLSLGEIRNKASGHSALTTARVGCLGLVTIHANSQMGIYERMTDVEIGLSIRALTSDEIVSLACYQSLVPLVCQHCAVPAERMPLAIQAQVKAVGEKFKVNTSKLRFAHGRIGDDTCPHCKGRGTQGQKVVAEMYSPTEPFLKALRAEDDFTARDIWRSESDGKFDTDDMRGKPVFLHALKDALDGRIDLRVCERFGSFDKFDVTTIQHGSVRRLSA